jgi:hypothetical protein
MIRNSPYKNRGRTRDGLLESPGCAVRPFSELDPKSISFSPRYTADPATDQLNLQLGVTWTHCDMRMFVNNALNSHPVLQRNADSGSSSLIYAYTFLPRTIGITSTWNY